MDGSLSPQAAAVAADPFGMTAMRVGEAWALDLELHPGTTRGPLVSALEPVVAEWATVHGWDPPIRQALGMGLSAAGLDRRHTERGERLYLRRADAARLRRMVCEAWAPRVPPGEKPTTRAQRAPLRTRLERLARALPTPEEVAAGTFHGELRGSMRPVCDHLGHCWPSLTLAEGSLTPKYRRKRHLQPGIALFRALRAHRPWHGRLWRYMLLGEVAAVPADAPCGVRLEACSWAATQRTIMQLTRSQMEVYGSGAVTRDDDREG